MDEQNVGNYLLERGVDLRRLAWRKEIVCSFEDLAEVMFNFEIQTLERTKPIKEFAFDDEDVFFGHARWLSLRREAGQ